MNGISICGRSSRKQSPRKEKIGLKSLTKDKQKPVRVSKKSVCGFSFGIVGLIHDMGMCVYCFRYPSFPLILITKALSEVFEGSDFFQEKAYLKCNGFLGQGDC